MSDIKVYRYDRGEFSCDVIVTNKDTLSFCNIKVPEGTPKTVEEQLLVDAEISVLAKLEQDTYGGYGTVRDY